MSGTLTPDATGWFVTEGQWLGRLVFQRALAAIYVVAFLSARNQFRALLGTHGLMPIPAYLRRVPFRRAPSLFQWRYSDGLFEAVCWVGIVLGLASVIGVTGALPLGACMAVYAVLWALYLSVVNVGQAWYSFGWESLLLEAGFLAIFLGNGATAPPVLILWLLRWLLFRLEFGAGLIKIRGDRCWRDLTCLHHHHETQPMPGPLSWWFHQLPKPLHRVEVAANHVTQLVVPFGLFAPQPVSGTCAAIMIVTQLWLVASGNFSWLNWLAIVLALSVLPDSWWAFLLPGSGAHPEWSLPLWFLVVVLAATVLVVALSWRPAWNLLSRRQLMNASFDRLHLVNTYGAFGSVTKVRHEVVVEGTMDPPGGERHWEEYEFKGKPGDPKRLPRQFAPYHLRLDWLMWFAALSPAYAEPWFVRMLRALLEGDRPLRRLLRRDPFDGRPPVAVRARLFRYRFSTPAERRHTGRWWERTLVGDYAGPISRR
ncbi:MAG TPA: lipase maturation factor family protein [Segeticoccus sp.]|nr:lipase maturation factor family protein [Segeticoccus sp.]